MSLMKIINCTYQPHILLNGKCLVEFWSSDFASDYEIKIEGVSGGGKTVSLKKRISVK